MEKIIILHFYISENLLSNYHPDLTQVAAVQTPPIDHPNNNHMNSFDKLPTYAEVKDHRLSSTPMLLGNGVPNNTVIVEPSMNHLDNNSVDRVALRNDRNLANNTVVVSPIAPQHGGIMAHQHGGVSPIPSQQGSHSGSHHGSSNSPRVSEADNFRDSHNSLASVELPNNMDTDAVTWSTFDHRGGRLTLLESGVSLLIPEGAIRQGQTEEIYMAVCRDDKDRPRLSGNVFNFFFKKGDIRNKYMCNVFIEGLMDDWLFLIIVVLSFIHE